MITPPFLWIMCSMFLYRNNADNFQLFENIFYAHSRFINQSSWSGWQWSLLSCLELLLRYIPPFFVLKISFTCKVGLLALHPAWRWCALWNLSFLRHQNVALAVTFRAFGRRNSFDVLFIRPENRGKTSPRTGNTGFRDVIWSHNSSLNFTFCGSLSKGAKARCDSAPFDKIWLIAESPREHSACHFANRHSNRSRDNKANQYGFGDRFRVCSRSSRKQKNRFIHCSPPFSNLSPRKPIIETVVILL